MYPFFYGHSQESPHWLFLAVVFVPDHVLFVPLPPHGERDACSTSVYFCLSAFWLLRRLNCSLSNLLMSCKGTCLPPQRASWGESGIPGISLPGSVSRVRRLILYINLNLVSYTPFLLLKVTKAVAFKHTLALSGTLSLPLRKLRCQE